MVVWAYRSDKPGPWVEKRLGLYNVHDEWKCFGTACVIHNPSDHHMVWWEPDFEPSTGLISRFCPDHNVAHPDPDSLSWALSYNPGIRHVCKCECCKA